MRFLLVSFLSFGALLGFSACPQSQPALAPPHRTVGTQRAEALAGMSLAGTDPEYIAAVRANEETDFGFKVAGIVEIIGPQPHQNWEEGNEVKTGTVLARLQQGDFKNALISAKAADDFAAANNERLHRLLASNVISRQEVDKSNADRLTADAHLQQAEQDLRDSELRAPWDGVVFTRYINAGETVGAGKPVLRFGDVRVMSVELGVPDRLIAQFAVGREIDVDISALAGRTPFKGKISEVGVAASNAGRLYRVVIKVPNPDGVIRSGMTATARAGSASKPTTGQVLVPLSALIAPSSPPPPKDKPPTQLAVFVVKDGKASLRLVKTGDMVASSIIVTDGLQVGEEIVTKGASQLYEGALVDVR